MNTNTTMRARANRISHLAPDLFLVAVLSAYLINAALQVGFLTPILVNYLGDFAPWLAVAGALCFQFFRATIIITGLLDPSRDRKTPVLVQAVAFGATLLAVIEFWHVLAPVAEFWAIFLFGFSIIVAGYIAEIVFISRAHSILAGKEIEKNAAAEAEEMRERLQMELDFPMNGSGN